MQLNELDDEATLDTVLQEGQEGFYVDTVEKAEWVRRKLGQLDDELKRLKENYEDRTHRLETQRERLLGWYKPQLFLLLEKERAEGRMKGKTLYTAYGSISLRTIRRSLAIQHMESLLTHKDERIAKIAQEYSTVVQSQKFDTVAIKKAIMSIIEEEGVIPDGIDINSEREEIYFG